MTDKEILELAKTCGFDDMIGEKDDETDGVYYECWEEQLLKFAREIFEEGQQEEIRRQKTGIGYVNGMLVVDEF
jgi:hypothetical protein